MFLESFCRIRAWDMHYQIYRLYQTMIPSHQDYCDVPLQLWVQVPAQKGFA